MHLLPHANKLYSIVFTQTSIHKTSFSPVSFLFYYCFLPVTSCCERLYRSPVYMPPCQHARLAAVPRAFRPSFSKGKSTTRGRISAGGSPGITPLTLRRQRRGQVGGRGRQTAVLERKHKQYIRRRQHWLSPPTHDGIFRSFVGRTKLVCKHVRRLNEAHMLRKCFVRL